MFKNRLILLVATIASVLLISGCGEYEKLLKSRDFQKKYDTAVTLYEEGEFVKAGTLFDQVANIFRGTIKADTVKYYQAKSYYGQRDYMMAGHFFNELSATYANSVYVEEADFMVAYCHYKQSPRPELDQDNTFRAITAIQMFMVKHPNSERLNQCQEIIVEMSDKLVEKSFISAKLYYDLGYYGSAIIALRNSLIEYPETRFREELMFMILKSSYLLADGSVANKQKERFQATVDEYYSFIGEFPEGPHSREATRMYENSNNFLGRNNNQSS
ncbi:MAG: outer membrane protein assembly factor BamD [Bacteroidetes bacterium]|nr:outer membrane protein assembly factor BamD [Bacteroidota bacterium]